MNNLVYNNSYRININNDIILPSYIKNTYSTPETFNKDNEVNGWSGQNSNLSYSAKISKSMSDQLWTESDIDYLGKLYTIDIGS